MCDWKKWIVLTVFSLLFVRVVDAAEEKDTKSNSEFFSELVIRSLDYFPGSFDSKTLKISPIYDVDASISSIKEKAIKVVGVVEDDDLSFDGYFGDETRGRAYRDCHRCLHLDDDPGL